MMWRESAERFAEAKVVNAMAYSDPNCPLAAMLAPGFAGPGSKMKVGDLILLCGADGWAWAHVAADDFSAGDRRPVLEAFRTDVVAAPESVRLTGRKAA